MSNESKKWLEQLQKSGFPKERPFKSNTLKNFLRSISALDILPEQIRGDVLVIGPGTVMPEQSLIFTQETKFQVKRPEINNIICCDGRWSLTNNNVPLPLSYLEWGELPNKKENNIYTLNGWASEMLRCLPQTGIFDTVLAFRISLLENVFLEEDRTGINLISRIAKALKSGGHFIGSGSFENNDPKSINYLPSELKLLQYVELQEPTLTGDDSPMPFSRYHMGIILKKESGPERI